MDIEKQKTPVAVASPEPITVVTGAQPASAYPVDKPSSMGIDNTPMHDQPKMGAKCCRCCCDFRRAVIVVMIISMVLSFLTFLIAATGGDNTESWGYDASSEEDFVDEYNDEMRTTGIVVNLISILFAAGALAGAIHYNKTLVAIFVVWQFIAFVIVVARSRKAVEDAEDETGDDVDANIGAYVVWFVILMLWAYPSVGFVMEVHKGTMSRETYPREEYSCCCISNREIHNPQY